MAESRGWIRLHRAIVNNRKVQSLPESLFKWWVNLLLVADADGILPPADDIAFTLRSNVAAVGVYIEKLVEARLVDRVADGYRLHDWSDHQYQSDSAAERTRKYRERHPDKRRKKSGNVTKSKMETSPTSNGDGAGDKMVTPPEQNTEAETEQKESLRDSSDSYLIDREFDDRFWPNYPHKTGKPVARKSWFKARVKHDAEAILAGLQRYIADKPTDRPWLNPATFLNQERFYDEPAEPTGGKPATGHASVLAGLASIVAARNSDGRGEGLPPRGDNPHRGPTIDHLDDDRDLEIPPYLRRT